MARETPKNMTDAQGWYHCEAGDGFIAPGSHQADPCIHCNYVFHDRCFYSRDHSCVRSGTVPEVRGYASKAKGE